MTGRASGGPTPRAGVGKLVAGTNIVLTPASGVGPVVTVDASAGGGGVTQLIAGAGISVSPGGGTGAVTVSYVGAGGAVIKSTTFTGSGNWTPDPLMSLWRAVVIGGAGSGGSGARVASGTAASGGAGGAPGDIKSYPFGGGFMTAGRTGAGPFTVTIGATSTPGAGVNVNGAGNAGTTGGNATLAVTPPIVAFGGGGGGAGQSAAVSVGGSAASDTAPGVAASTPNVAGTFNFTNGLGGGSGVAGTNLSNTTMYSSPGGAGCGASGVAGNGTNGIYKHASAPSGGGLTTTPSHLAGGIGGTNLYNITAAVAGTAGGGNGNPAILPLAASEGANSPSGGGGNIAGAGGTGGSAPANGFGIPGAGGGACIGALSGAGGQAGGPAVVIIEILG